MIDIEIIRATQAEMAALAREREFRRQWDVVSRLDRLERALRTARQRAGGLTGQRAPAL